MDQPCLPRVNGMEERARATERRRLSARETTCFLALSDAADGRSSQRFRSLAAQLLPALGVGRDEQEAKNPEDRIPTEIQGTFNRLVLFNKKPLEAQPVFAGVLFYHRPETPGIIRKFEWNGGFNLGQAGELINGKCYF